MRAKVRKNERPRTKNEEYLLFFLKKWQTLARFFLFSATFAKNFQHNMKIRTPHLLILAALTVLFAACRSSKNASSPDTPTQPTTQPTTTLPPAAATPSAATLTTDSNFTAKIRASVKVENQHISTSGTLRMRLGEVIQVSLLDPILGITEVARMEISPTATLLIDRYNKRYVIMTYDDINSMAQQELSYNAIEYHFWQQALRTDTDELQFTIPTGSKTIDLNLRLSGKNNNSKWDAHTIPSNKYQQVAPEVLLRQILDL